MRSPKILVKISRRRWISSVSGILLGAVDGFRGAWSNAAVQDQKAPSAVDTVDVNRTAISSFEAVEKNLTPVDQFFERSHHHQPVLSMSDWSLRVEGNVSTPLNITFSDLIESPTQKLEAVLECAGNRGFLVSNGLWEGVSLVYFLKQAGLKSSSGQVLLEGADEGRLVENHPSYPFARLVPLAQCLSDQSLVAFKLNDQFLPPRNGFPARALFAGRYAMDSVKWLRRIVVLGAEEKPDAFYSSGMHLLYRRWVRTGQDTRMTSRVSKTLVRSVIAYPTNGAYLAAGRYVIWGFAWSGNATITGVQVSTDGGTGWYPAKLESQATPFAWVRWSFDWLAPAGDHSLSARAQDGSGDSQPIARDPNRLDGYEYNSCEVVKCSVR